MKSNETLITDIEQCPTLPALAERFGTFVEGLREKIWLNLATILSGAGIELLGLKPDIVARLKFLDGLEIDIKTLFQFFESPEYWALEYRSTDDHVRNTKEQFPHPLYYAARQCLDYVLFPTYYLRRNEIITELAKHFDVNDEFAFLDAGVGSGEITDVTLKRFPRSSGVGIDVIPENLEFARKFLQRDGNDTRCSLQEMDIQNENTGIGSHRYDAIICSEVLEHLADPEKTIQLFFESLKACGILIVTVPLNDPGHEHLQNFNEKSFMELVPQSFTVIRKVIMAWNGHCINSPVGAAQSSETIEHLFLVLQKQ